MNPDSAEELDRLLRPPSALADPLLRAKLRDVTTRSLLRQRQRHRFGFAAALVACYAAGLATVWLLRPTSVVRPPDAAPIEMAKQHELPASARTEPTPQLLELQAEQADGPESARLYVAAARRFGRDFGDWDGALRCYRNAFDAAPELIDTTDSADDDWLMITLKKARKKEKTHASDLD